MTRLGGTRIQTLRPLEKLYLVWGYSTNDKLIFKTSRMKIE